MQGVHSSCHFDTVLSSLLQLSLLITSSFTFRVRRASMGQQTMQIETTVIVHADSYIGHANMWLSSTGRPEEIVIAQHQVQVRARVQGRQPTGHLLPELPAAILLRRLPWVHQTKLSTASCRATKQLFCSGLPAGLEKHLAILAMQELS